MKTETIVGSFILIALAIFFYMTFFLGVFRVDRLNYRSYSVYFNNVAGLEKKADVKIAGVKVGWVDRIELLDEDYYVKANIMVHKNYVLRNDAHAVVRQDGFLGSKYLEITPGDPLLGPLKSGQSLGAPGRPAVQVDDILYKVSEIARHVEEVTRSLHETLGGQQGQATMRTMIDNLQQASERFASFSGTLDRTLSHNEESLNSIIGDFKVFARDIADSFPSIKDSVERVSNRLDHDIASITEKLGSAIVSLDEASMQVRDGFKNIGSVASKIDEGQGTIGKLINEEETYRDLKVTVQGLKNYFSKVDALNIVLDTHGEYMYRPAEHVNFEDAKGYFDARIHPSDDHFYLFQIVLPQRGIIDRTLEETRWYDEDFREFLPSVLVQEGKFVPELVGKVERRRRLLDKPMYGFQFGKIFRDFAVRFGVFESSAGAGIDFDIPFGTDKFRWVTSLEMFDFKGRNRWDDKRPHLKWLNRLFILRNMYMVFGADDFVSKENANGFFGGGLRFCDDDLKYLLAKFGLG